MAEPLNWEKHLHKEGCESFFAKPYLQNIQRYDMHFDRVKQELDNEPWARRHPLMLLKGFLHAKMEQTSKAIECFEDVLKEDRNSLNANLNLIFINMGFEKKRKSEKYLKNIQEISKNETVFRQCILRARYQYAETMSMVQLYKDGQPGFKWVKDYYKKVVDDSEGSDISPCEIIDWQFGFAFLCMSIDSLHGKNDQEFYYTARQKFYEIASGKGNAIEESSHFEKGKKPGGNPEDYQKLLRMRCGDVIPKSWCFLAALFSRHGREKEKLEGVDFLQEHQNFTLKNCIEEAIKLGPENPVVLRRAGQAYMTVGMMDEAKHFLEKALSLEKNECDYTFNLLGRWYSKMYEERKDDPKRMDYLDSSIEHYEKAVEMKTSICHTYRNLAEAYFIKQNYDEAIEKCRMSKVHGGQYDPKLYTIWGDCLEAQGEDAKKCRLKAERLRKGDFDVNWKFGTIYCDADSEGVAHIVSHLEHMCEVRGWYLDRNVQPGEDIVENSNAQLKKCEYLLAFFSESEPEPLTDRILKCCYTTRIKIVPVLLGGNEQVPDVLKSCRAIKYDESQAFYDAFKQLFHGETTMDGLAKLVQQLKIESEHASEFAEEKQPKAESPSKTSGAAAGFPLQADDGDN